MTTRRKGAGAAIEWPTLAICLACYVGFFFTTALADTVGYLTAGALLAIVLTLYSSFSHEVLHGHPFADRHLNEALVFPALGLLIPYERFRDTHLAHHHDPSLTDPYDDPESNFVDPKNWESWCGLRRALYRINNTLAGRILIGPLIGLLVFYASDMRLIAKGDRRVQKAYTLHFAGLVPVLWWFASVAEMPFWVYLSAVYASHSILKIRTFLEHRMHEHARCRSVIIEKGGLLGFLFLNNNLHAVHHARPNLPWYRLPAFYASNRARFLKRNGGYSYKSYGEVFGEYLFFAKDPVPHLSMPVSRIEKEGSFVGDRLPH